MEVTEVDSDSEIIYGTSTGDIGLPDLEDRLEDFLNDQDEDSCWIDCNCANCCERITVERQKIPLWDRSTAYLVSTESILHLAASARASSRYIPVTGKAASTARYMTRRRRYCTRQLKQNVNDAHFTRGSVLKTPNTQAGSIKISEVEDLISPFTDSLGNISQQLQHSNYHQSPKLIKKHLKLSSLSAKYCSLINSKNMPLYRKERFIYNKKAQEYFAQKEHFGLIRYQISNLNEKKDTEFSFLARQMYYSPFKRNFISHLSESLSFRWKKGAENLNMIQCLSLVANLNDCNSELIYMFSETTLNNFESQITKEKITILSQRSSCSEVQLGLSYCIKAKDKQPDHTVLLQSIFNDQQGFILVSYEQEDISGELRLVGNHPQCTVRRIQDCEVDAFLDEGCLIENDYFTVSNVQRVNGERLTLVDSNKYTKFERELKETTSIFPGFSAQDEFNICTLGQKMLDFSIKEKSQKAGFLDCECQSHITPGTPFETYMVENFEIYWICLVSFPTTILEDFFNTFKLKRPHHRLKWDDVHLSHEYIKENSYSKHYYICKKDRNIRLVIKLNMDYLIKPKFYVKLLQPVA